MKSTQELPDWKEPASLEEAETQAFALWEEIQSIQLQLADPNRIGENKQRLSVPEYLTWQHRAKYALTMKIRAYRYLKQWIKDRRVMSHEHPISCDAPTLETVYACIRNLLTVETEELLKLYGTQKQQQAYRDLKTQLPNTSLTTGLELKWPQ